MERHSGEFSISAMSRVRDVARSGFYAWRSRQAQPSPRQQARERLDHEVQVAFGVHKSRYGAPRLTRDLVDAGFSWDPKTVAASMARQGLRAKAARKFRVTTQSRHNLPVAPNLLLQDFTAVAPDRKWAGDITYLWTDEGWLYLAVVLDLDSRRVIGWSMSRRITADLVCNALRMALWRRGHPRDVVVHSDRGSQYCSGDYQALIKKHRLRCSMSAKGNFYDNACVESFFHSMKVEAIHGERFPTRRSAREAVFEYIEIDYNRTRRHSANGYLSPEAFEAQRVA